MAVLIRVTAPGKPAGLHVGVDGGGSRCRVRIRDATGRMVGEAVAGPANATLDLAAAVRSVEAALSAALAGAGVSGGAARGAVALGLAGVSSPAVAQRVVAALAGVVEAPLVVSDAEIACVGAHAGEDGGLIIAGTGSGAVARLGGRSLAIGGRGFLLGDDGSGARLGLSALRLALRAHDGLAPATPLLRSLMDPFGNDPVAAIAWGRTAKSSDFAALAPTILAAATDGDSAGFALVERAVAALAELGGALRARGVVRLSLVGGLAGPLAPFLPPAFAQHLAPPHFDALDGALLLAGCPAAVLPRQVQAGRGNNAVDGAPHSALHG